MIATTPELLDLLATDPVIAIGVSGGKDSCAVALRLNKWLDRFGHVGPRLLIHSDLGKVEWRDSLPTCERLAHRCQLELAVVRRPAGGMMERWETRWAANVQRYANLECVKLILPWSTPALRFCTSELKTDVIDRYLARRFQGACILSVSGIRAEESPARSKAAILKPQAKLTRTSLGTQGYDWNPLLLWTAKDVFEFLEAERFTPHEAYWRYGSSRVSCAFCIMASPADLFASSNCEDNQDVYRQMVRLEIDSTFSFQSDRWLGDIAPSLLLRDARYNLPITKVKAVKRELAEAAILRHLLYTEGWPTCIPTRQEAELLCRVRTEVSDVVGFEARYLQPGPLIERYEELFEQRRAKECR
ncbi:MAG TPA: phosphoadenosine phosphosulfate reductase family protein [Blastocatellia bacterium]